MESSASFSSSGVAQVSSDGGGRRGCREDFIVEMFVGGGLRGAACVDGGSECGGCEYGGCE